MNGGYVMIKASDSNAYGKLLNAITLGKPILYYENDTTCYYIDTITKDGDDNIILTKGGKTITIASDNTITTSGKIQDTFHRYRIDVTDSGNNSYIIFAFLKNLPYEVKKSLDVDSDMFDYLTNNVLDKTNVLVDYSSSTVIVINDYNADDLELELVKYDGTSFSTITVSKIYFSLAD